MICGLTGNVDMFPTMQLRIRILKNNESQRYMVSLLSSHVMNSKMMHCGILFLNALFEIAIAIK